MVKVSQIVPKNPITGSHDLPYRETGTRVFGLYLWWAFCYLIIMKKIMKNAYVNKSTALMFVAGIVLTLVVVGFSSISRASEADITVCVSKEGRMRMIGEGFESSDCKKNEKLMTFNTQGPIGQQGPQGIAGNDGTTIPCVHVDGNDVYFDGCNIHIRSGSGSTFGVTNGLGNLIVGYNEDTGGPYNRTGSHNIIIGPYHTYSSFGGIVAGVLNTISAGSASVLGGVGNVASGVQSVVSSGSGNTSKGIQSSVSGGTFNTASGDNSVISGGKYNEASGNGSSVSGGQANLASGIQSSVSGGFERSAVGTWNWMGGSLFQAN